MYIYHIQCVYACVCVCVCVCVFNTQDMIYIWSYEPVKNKFGSPDFVHQHFGLLYWQPWFIAQMHWIFNCLLYYVFSRILCVKRINLVYPFPIVYTWYASSIYTWSTTIWSFQMLGRAKIARKHLESSQVSHTSIYLYILVHTSTWWCIQCCGIYCHILVCTIMTFQDLSLYSYYAMMCYILHCTCQYYTALFLSTLVVQECGSISY